MTHPYSTPGPSGRTTTPDTRPLHRRKRVWATGLLLLLVGSCVGAAGGDDPSRPAPAPTATVTVTATPEPAPTVTATETVTARPEPDPEPEETAEGDGTGGGGGAVHYANCDEARAAGAAPVHRGEPGYGRHLDRDGDGVGCDT
ncbi:excalibur calcium-binding domain-containing protein [Streptomyces sp. NPDC047130]|uniref:excalibur calcium-binding domain-containing protein n=1 Tax=Streptomyces sp. NPDC047130 TaxID=3155261 RepID=UPI0033D9AEC3